MKILTEIKNAEIEVKRSRFIASLSRAGSEEEAAAFIEAVRKKHRDARHNCFAMRVSLPDILERSSDDGEPSGTAGRPMLDMLKGFELVDTVAVVTRYFGGTLLGPGGLVRAYSDALREALSSSNTAELCPGEEAVLVSGYELLNQIKYNAGRYGISICSEEYSEQCRLSLIIDDESRQAFVGEIERFSMGRLRLTEERPVLYYEQGKRMEIYKYLP